jgi:hypothetical protein
VADELEPIRVDSSFRPRFPIPIADLYRPARRTRDRPLGGSRGEVYDNALAEAVNAAYKTELIHRGTSWRCIDYVELSTAEWVGWYNLECLHKAIGNVPPAEHEAALTGTSHPASQPTPALATEQEQNLG